MTLQPQAPLKQACPDVLEVRWQLEALAKEWEASLSLARALIQKAPARPSGWVNLSFALHELKMTKDAIPIGGCLPMVLQFPLLIAFYTAVTVSLAIRQASFMWLPDLSAAALVPAKVLGANMDPNNLMFNTYEQYIGR